MVAVARTITRLSVRFVGRIDDARQRIYFANHTSHLDFILIWSSLPRHVRERTRPVAGRDYWERSRFRRYYVRKVFDAVLIDRPLLDAGTLRGDGERNRPEALEQMLKGLGDEHSLILFPEGTRGSGESIAQFRSGLFYLCRERPDVELVPVRIHGAHRVLPKGRIIPRPQESDLTFGPPMHLEDGETKTAFIERARTALRML
jgi:1-acyl-sn-glycerol-3-phosphate acyltransferase